tara:strand:+ start:13493 stop:14869 length:1377 start_codon:yes stop_codon:yes gene_type:complete
MEQMTQELSIDNHNIKSLKKMYNDSIQSNLFFNTYTLMDVENAKQKLYSKLLLKYNYKNTHYIERFIEDSSRSLAEEIFNNKEVSNKLENTINSSHTKETKYNHRIVNIDSLYRSNLYDDKTYDTKSSSDMNIELNDSLNEVVSLELSHVCIPFTFYNITSNSGNNYFYVDDVKIEISSGNYDNTSLMDAITDSLSNNYITDLSFSVDSITNKTIITSSATSGSRNIKFYDFLNENYDFSNKKTTNKYNTEIQSKVNNNLGWILGFRDISGTNIEYTIDAGTSITSEGICYIPYTKYFIIVLDDLNKNQNNKGLVQISNSKEIIKKEKYFNNNDNSLNCLTSNNFNTYVNSSGRTLTKNQLYSILQVNNEQNKLNENNIKLDGNLINNVFAVIPFESKSLVWGELNYVSDKSRYKRVYKGPVDINNMNIKLLDDKGNLLDLNGSDWSMNIISTHLYKY